MKPPASPSSLKGENLASAVGKRVEITGTLDALTQPVAGAAQTIKVIDLKVLATTAGHAKAGMTGAHKAIIAGVVVGAGTAGGLAIGLTRGGKEPISR